ncbi:CLUMA_CG003653, isoform A [Clunio marinus]|uniref:CLUMA_CG003653, isoform A n=1 Tax=Clunio marinus TaxID=568069 RepID=A0A1J1HQV8_9DIPT|nr:CLUMA_CG003653, isoform A [Clunio marinus]
MSSASGSLGGPHKNKKIVLKSALNESIFNFMHINPGSIKPHIDEIKMLVSGLNLHVLAISETWLSNQHNNNLINIPGYSIKRHDRIKKRGGGVALYIHETIRSKIIAKSHEGIKLAIGVVYNPPNNNRMDTLSRILQEISTKYEHAIVLGDFNINLLMNTPKKNKFVNLIRSVSLECPSIEPSNFVPNKTPSLIDLILVKQLNLLKRFSQLPLGSYTTHDLIFGSYNIAMINKNKIMHKSVRNFDNVCSEKLNAAAIKQNWNTIYDIDDVDEQVNYFNELILELMNFFCPIKICKVNNDCRPDWLSDKLLQLINARNFFYEAARNQKNATEKLFLKQQFIKLRNSVNVMKRNLKRKCLLKRMDVNLPNTILWKNLNTFGVTKSKSTISDSFSSTDFNNYFSSVFTPSDIDSFCDSNEDLSNDVIQELDFENVTNDEVFNALNLIKTKAIGEDGISICRLNDAHKFSLKALSVTRHPWISKS